MRKKQALVSWTRRQIVAGIFLSIVLALLAVGVIHNFVSSNSISPTGTRVTLVSPAGDGDGPQPGSTIWDWTPIGGN